MWTPARKHGTSLAFTPKVCVTSLTKLHTAHVENALTFHLGMNKKLSYCIAFSPEGAVDVTHRYVRSSRFAAERTRCTEAELLHIVKEITGLRRGKLSVEERFELERGSVKESKELRSYAISGVVWEFCRLSLEEMREGNTAAEPGRSGSKGPERRAGRTQNQRSAEAGM